MNHQEAVESRAVERYMLGELSDAERDGFEEHFFDCLECAEDVRAGTVFAANARAVFAEEAGQAAESRAQRITWLSGWRPAFAFAGAAAVLLVALGYQALLVVPQLRKELAQASQPQAYPAFFLRAVSRGEDQLLEVPRNNRFFGLSLDLPPERVFSSYECRLAPEPGGAAFSITAPAPSSSLTPLNILVPVSKVRPGRYVLTLIGRDQASGAAELGRYIFVVNLK